MMKHNFCGWALGAMLFLSVSAFANDGESGLFETTGGGTGISTQGSTRGYPCYAFFKGYRGDYEYTGYGAGQSLDGARRMAMAACAGYNLTGCHLLSSACNQH